MLAIDALAASGYIVHIRQPGEDALAAGYRAELPCYRALFEARWDLFTLS